MSRILVVDDEEGLREFIAEVLEDEGHEVDRAKDGVEALELVERSAYALMLSDLKMPRMDGLELTRRVRAQQPELEIIVLTAHGSVGSAVVVGVFETRADAVAARDALAADHGIDGFVRYL